MASPPRPTSTLRRFPTPGKINLHYIQLWLARLMHRDERCGYPDPTSRNRKQPFSLSFSLNYVAMQRSLVASQRQLRKKRGGASGLVDRMGENSGAPDDFEPGCPPSYLSEADCRLRLRHLYFLVCLRYAATSLREFFTDRFEVLSNLGANRFKGRVLRVGRIRISLKQEQLPLKCCHCPSKPQGEPTKPAEIGRAHV